MEQQEEFEEIQIPEGQFKFEFSTSSGHGGQNVNKVATKVTASLNLDKSPLFTPEQIQSLENYLLTKHKIHIEDGDRIFQISSQKTRYQARNRTDAIEKANELINEALRPEKERETKIPKKIKRRADHIRITAKKIVSEKKGNRKRPTKEDYEWWS